MEIPLLVIVAIVVVAILIPHLSSLGRKILISIAAVPILFALYYMIVIPGWMPGDKTRLRPPWNWLVFLLVAALIVVVVVMIVLGDATGIASDAGGIKGDRAMKALWLSWHKLSGEW
jgi:hypothetical protein